MVKKATAAETEQQAAIFKALADPTRLRLVQHLCHQEEPNCICVNALAGMLGVSQPAVSQHLRVLKSIGLVKGQREGCCVHYGIDHDALLRCHEIILTALADKCCDGRR